MSDILVTLSVLIDALQDPFAFAFLVTVCVLILGYYSRTDGLSFFVAVGLTFSSTQALKAFFAIPRPELTLVAVTGYRFPSLHAAIAGVICTSFCWYLWRHTRSWTLRILGTALLGGALLLVAYSRLLLGVHHLPDVIAGALLGIAISSVIHFVSRNDAVVK